MSAILPPILLSAAVGITSKTYTILASFNQILCRQTSHQKKIFKVDSYIGVAIAGLTADGRVLAKSLRSECVSYTHKYNSPLPVGRLVVQLPYKPQVSTQLSWKRPHGVDSLLAGVDESGAHLYYNFSECQAFAIGYRSQAANAYLERKLEDFVSTTREDLIKDAIFALRETLEGERLTSSNCTVSVVGVNEVFHILDEEFVQIYIDCSNGLK